jgi:S-adenosylmethionine:tRNA ribosyltransferase-isomerase
MTTATQPRLAAATAPIESTGRERHDVSLLVASADATIDTRFHRMAEHLSAGDVLVVNDSATEPAAMDGCHRGVDGGIHVSGPTDDGRWVVELRRADRSGPILTALRGDRIDVADGSFTLCQPTEKTETGVRLWAAVWNGRHDLTETLRRSGRPIRYGYVPDSWPTDAYRTLFGRRRREFSSAEMPSAARPFTTRVVGDLERRGIEIAHITLHTGVSSLESHEAPRPERFEVDARAVTLINQALSHGRRVVAVGTTSARAVESAAIDDSVAPVSGCTDLVLSTDRPTRVVNGIVTGWHPPEASHLDLLEAVAGPKTVSHAYRTASELGYRSHEFGDSCLLLRT